MFKEFPFKIDPKLKRKLDKLISTLGTKDIWILIDGDEGSGKTNTAAYILYYFHCMLGREFILDNFYFDSEALFEYVKSHEEALVNWDEAALGGLSSEWYTKAQVNLLKFAMTGRKKRHIFVLCIPRFDKLKEDLRRDRIHAMIHMDTGKEGNDYGHFVYLTRRGIKHLNDIWKKKHIRAYMHCARKYGGFASNIDVPYIFDKVLDEAAYEKKKDEAIESIGEKKRSTEHALKYKLSQLQYPIKSKTELAKQLDIDYNSITRWERYNSSNESNKEIDKNNEKSDDSEYQETEGE